MIVLSSEQVPYFSEIVSYLILTLDLLYLCEKS